MSYSSHSVTVQIIRQAELSELMQQRPHALDLNCLYRGSSFIYYTYENNQQQTHKAGHLFWNPICHLGELPQNIIHLISPWISRHDWVVLSERRHQDGLMGLEFYAGTIWAALAFKLQSSGEMGNDNCIKIKRISNWPSQQELALSLSADRPLLYCGESCCNADVRTSRSYTLSPSSHLQHDMCG